MSTVHHVPLARDPTLVAADRRALGRWGEDLAAAHLVADGLGLVAQNWRLRVEDLVGELDLVAHDPAAEGLVVCEVKVRRGGPAFGGAIAALGPEQRRRIRRLAGAFVRGRTERITSVRFDVVAIDVGARPTLVHLLGAW